MTDRSNEIEFRLDYATKKEHLIIGLMSGTSLDGIDAALVRILSDEYGRTRDIGLLRHSYLPYSEELRQRVATLCSAQTARVDDLVYAHYGLSEWYAEAVHLTLREAACPVSRLDAVCVHGQTIWHAPQPLMFPGPRGAVSVKGTLQLGSSAVLRERVGVPIVADLRARDMAAGGEGAPLAPYLDLLLFGSLSEGRIVQNIGGIANATVLPAGTAPMGAAAASGASSDILAFDTGPGNMVMDAAAAAISGGAEQFDRDGRMAARGRVSVEMVERLMSDPYFARRPPKSTGREVYGAAFVAAFMNKARFRGLGPEDMLATLTAFTAESIARAYRDFVFPAASISTVFVAGGGARNPTLMRMIGERMPEGLRVMTAEEAGMPDQAREAMAFALLGHESIMGRPGNLPSATGARAPVVLGTITL